MRPTGEAFEPVSGDFVSRLLKGGCSSSANFIGLAPPPHRAACSGVPGDATRSGRFL